MSTDDQPCLNIRGEQAALGPLRRDLLPLYTRWRNDFAIQWTFGNLPEPVTEDRQAQWLDRQTNGDAIWFTVYQLEPFRPVGITDLFEIDYRWGTARFGVLIGEEGARGVGLGTEVARLMLDYAFTVLGLYNEAGRRAYEKAGFREIGRRRGADLTAGHRYDEIFMDCITTGFESPVLANVFSPDRLRRRS